MLLRVQHRHSDVAGSVPPSLLPHEIGVNTADKKLYVGDVSGVPIDYIGVALAGAPAVVQRVTITARTTAILNTSLYTTPTRSLYRISYYAAMSSLGTAGIVQPGFGWLDGNNNAVVQGANLPATGGFIQGSVVLLAAASTSINYVAGFSGVTGPAAFNLLLSLERLI